MGYGDIRDKIPNWVYGLGASVAPGRVGPLLGGSVGYGVGQAVIGASKAAGAQSAPRQTNQRGGGPVAPRRTGTGGRGVSPSMANSSYRPVGGNVFGDNPVDPFSGKPVGPGSPIPPGPGMGAPPVITNSAGRTRAENANTAYQQAGGRGNYWEENPDMKRAAEEGPKAGDVGYSDRADIQAWMDAQGRDSAIVKKFLADQERKGLIRRSDNFNGKTDWAGNSQGIDYGTPEYGTSSELSALDLEGGRALGDSRSALEREIAAMSPEERAKAYGTEAVTVAPSGARFQGDTDWAAAAPEGVSLRPGNFTTSGQVRDMNLSGAEALGRAHVTQATQTRSEPGAENFANTPGEQRPEDDLLGKHLFGASVTLNGDGYDDLYKKNGILPVGMF